MDDQLSLFDGLDPTVVATMAAEPGWIWARCPTCSEVRYLRRADAGSRCLLTPGCEGRLEPYLDVTCVVCGKPVTRRRTGKDTDYCSKKCEEAKMPCPCPCHEVIQEGLVPCPECGS